MSTRLGPEPCVAASATVVDSVLGQYTEIGERTRFRASVLGDYSYIVEDGDVLTSTIGKFCSIAAAVRINPSNHPMWRASQHHFTYRAADYFDGADMDEDFFAWRRAHPVTIGHDVWIGHGATVMPGVTIGTGAVIGAGAVVTKAVAPYAIVAGVPARPLRQRFAAGVANRLLALAWWNWPHHALRDALHDFRDLSVDAFLKKYETH